MIFFWTSLLMAFQILLGSCSTDQEKRKDMCGVIATITSNGGTIEKRFPVPEGFDRIPVDSLSFGHFLRNLPLHPEGSVVRYYNGEKKENRDVYAAVVNLPIGKRDLHQCADAVMRLRADYLRSQHRPDEIQFQFTNGFNAMYSRWIKGERIQVSGNNCQWIKGGEKGDSDTEYWRYLEMVFNYAGTLSLSKELLPQTWNKMEIGDVLIKGGSPGHAVIVVDMAENKNTHEKIYMLAQSYMPAQEIQILLNPAKRSTSVWYTLSTQETIETPEWKFDKKQLKKFL